MNCEIDLPTKPDLFEPLVFLSSTALFTFLAVALIAALLPAPWNVASWLVVLYLFLLPVLAIRTIVHLPLAKAVLVAVGASIVGFVAVFKVTTITAGHQWIVEFGDLF